MKKFRQNQHRKWDRYRKQQVYDRAAAQVQLELLEDNLADRIERASARYNDIVKNIIKIYINGKINYFRSDWILDWLTCKH